MSSEETLKHLTDVARTRPNEFLVIKQAQRQIQSKQYVTVSLENVKDEIEHMKAFIERGEFE